MIFNKEVILRLLRFIKVYHYTVNFTSEPVVFWKHTLNEAGVPETPRSPSNLFINNRVCSELVTVIKFYYGAVVNFILENGSNMGRWQKGNLKKKGGGILFIPFFLQKKSVVAGKTVLFCSVGWIDPRRLMSQQWTSK